MDGMKCEKSEIQRFCCKNVSLRWCGSFNGSIELFHLELLTRNECGCME